jgi:hypothetical protein
MAQMELILVSVLASALLLCGHFAVLLGNPRMQD